MAQAVHLIFASSDTAWFDVVPFFKKDNDHPKRPKSIRKSEEKPIDDGKNTMEIHQ